MLILKRIFIILVFVSSTGCSSLLPEPKNTPLTTFSVPDSVEFKRLTQVENQAKLAIKTHSETQQPCTKLDARDHDNVISLAVALDLGLCHHPKTAVAWQRVKEYENRIALSKTDFNPQATVNYRLQDSYNTEFKRNGVTQQLSLQADWLLYDFGERQAKLDQAITEHQAVSAEFVTALQEVIYDVSEKYEDLVFWHQLVSVRTKNTLLAQKSVTIAQDYYKAGYGLKSDVFLAKSAFSETKLASLEAKNERQKAEKLLLISMGVNKATLVPKSRVLSEVPKRNDKLKEAIERAVFMHPKILAQSARVETAKSELNSIESENQPRVSLIGSMNGYQKFNADQMYTSDLSIGLNIRIPLSDGGKQAMRRMIQQSVIEQQQRQLDLMENNLRQKIDTNLHQLESAIAQYATASDIKKNAQQGYDATLGRYQYGVSPFSEFIDAQKDIQNANEKMAQAQHLWYKATLNLREALGQLTPIKEK